MMKKLAVLAALSLLPAFAGPATAQSLSAEDAVAYLLVGAQANQPFDLSGVTMTWSEAAPGHFSANGTSDGHKVEMSVTVAPKSGCVYDVSGNVVVDGKSAYDQLMTYDFTKISGMALSQPNVASITGTGFCTGKDQSLCTNDVALAVTTDAATFDKVYGDFRKNSCP